MDKKTQSIVTIVFCIIVIGFGVWYQISNSGQERSSIMQTVEKVEVIGNE